MSVQTSYDEVRDELKEGFKDCLNYILNLIRL